VTGIKVTDKRMFTPDGQLRPGVERELAEAAAAAPAEPAPPAPEPVPPPETPAQPAPAVAGALPGSAPVAPPAGLLELVEFLAGWALATMGEVPMPDGTLVRDLDASRFYIDLIGALHERWARALAPEELRFLEGYLDQLRLRFVSRRS
jgi:hypothetical protein